MSERIKDGGPAFQTWKPLPGIPHIEVSDLGAVRTWIDRRRTTPNLQMPRDLKASYDDKGYRIVSIRDDRGLKKTYRVCRLVLLAFVGAPSEGFQACHGNNVKSDDRLDNLRWDTPSGNTIDQVNHGVHRGLRSRGEAHPLHKLKTDQVLKIKSMLSDGLSSIEVARHFGVPRTTINNIKIGKSWRHAEAPQ